MLSRSSISSSILVLALISGSVPASAQEHGAGVGQEPAEWLQVINDVDACELVFIVGPLDLPAGAGHQMIEQPPIQTGAVPEDAYITGFEIQLRDASGQPVPQRVLHHVNLIDFDHRELFSPVARRLFAAGSETQPAAMPRILGIPVSAGQQLAVSAMFHNPTGESYSGARLYVRLKYRKEGWFFPIGVYPVYIDVMGHVGEKEFDLPPGRSERSWEGSPAVAGRLLAVGGHLHDNAVVLRFEDVTEGKVLWETGPELDRNGQVVGVPIGKFWWKGGIGLTPKHTYRLTVVYDNPAGETVPGGGMGVLGGIFKPSGEWPALDPDDPDYLINTKTTHLRAEMRAMGIDTSHGAHRHGVQDEGL